MYIELLQTQKKQKKKVVSYELNRLYGTTMKNWIIIFGFQDMFSTRFFNKLNIYI